MDASEAAKDIGNIGLAKMVDEIKDDVKLLGVDFDVWFSERTLFDQGQYERAMVLLEDSG